MEMMFSIMAEHKSEYIKEIRERLDDLKKQKGAESDQAQRVRIGIFEYLLGAQYLYQNNKKMGRSCLETALKHCAGTPYEREIQALLVQK